MVKKYFCANKSDLPAVKIVFVRGGAFSRFFRPPPDFNAGRGISTRFTILKIQRELIDMAKKLDTKSQKSHDYSPKNAQFLGEFSLRRLPKKHNRLKIIVAYRENRKAANHKQCITKTNMLESKSTNSLEL